MGSMHALDPESVAEVGEEMPRLAAEPLPIRRSNTGDGIRRTLALIQDRIPLQTLEVPSGTAVFDWTVPKEWNVRDAYVKKPGGQRLVDFQVCNLQVMNYSTPVHATLPPAELPPHLFTLP